MFTNSRAIDDRATAASFDTAYQKYAAATDSWFDGSPFSVDNRLAQCRRLMNLTRAHVARRGAEAGPLNRLAELETDARALVALREDLLTGGFDREDTSRIAGVYVASGDERPFQGRSPIEREKLIALMEDYDMSPEEAVEEYNRRYDWSKDASVHSAAGPLKEEHDGMAPWEAADEEKGATKLAADDIYFDPHGEYAAAAEDSTENDYLFDEMGRYHRDRFKGEGKEAMAVPRGTDPLFTPHVEGGPHGDIYLGDGDWKSDYGMEPDDEDRARWAELTRQRDEKLRQYIENTGLDPYVPEWQAREEKAERERRNKESSLSPQDRRFVTLEATRFLADNTDTNDARELATRAMHLAQKATSTFDVNRSRAVTAAFVSRVAAGAQHRQRIASAAPRPSVRTASVDSFPPEALFF